MGSARSLLQVNEMETNISPQLHELQLLGSDEALITNIAPGDTIRGISLVGLYYIQTSRHPFLPLPAIASHFSGRGRRGIPAPASLPTYFASMAISFLSLR